MTVAATAAGRGGPMPLPWVLLIDTPARSMIIVSVSAVILWWKSHRKCAGGIALEARKAAARREARAVIKLLPSSS